MKKKYILPPLAILFLCFLIAGAFFYGKSQGNQSVRTVEEEKVSTEESLKVKASSSCADEASKKATDKLKELNAQEGTEASKSALESEIRKQLRTDIINCSL